MEKEKEEKERIQLNIRKGLVMKMNTSNISHKIVIGEQNSINQDCMLLKCQDNSMRTHKQFAQPFS